jgi:1,2-diacylglycerol-3-alpha-glucose alpha-1,2-glucosyltransferase
MRVCLYLEAESAVAKSGFKRAFESHQKALRLAGVDVTTDPADEPYDLLHLHAFGPKSLYYLSKAKRDGVKVVVHAHSVGAHDFRDSFTMSNVIAPLYEAYLKFFYEQGDAIFTPSEFARRQLVKAGLTKRIEVVSNGVDRELFRFSPEKRARYRAAFGLQRFTVFGAGNIIPRKGIIDFLDVAERLPQYDFIWYGHRWPRALAFHPQMEKHLEEKPPNVRLPGFVEDPSGVYAAADALLFPSHTETQGLVILEAASLGRPVIVRDLPEYVDWLYHGENCLKGRSVEEFCEQITCLAEDPALYERLQQGAERLAEAHSLDVVGRRLVALYRSVLEQPARPDRREPVLEPPFQSLANLHDDFRRHPGL